MDEHATETLWTLLSRIPFAPARTARTVMATAKTESLKLRRRSRSYSRHATRLDRLPAALVTAGMVPIGAPQPPGGDLLRDAHIRLTTADRTRKERARPQGTVVPSGSVRT